MRKLLAASGIAALAFVFSMMMADAASAQVSCSPAWTANTFYSVNATVGYNGRGYRCQQAHTSQVGWEPASAPALWVDLGACSGAATPTTPPRATATTRPRATATATSRTRATATSTARPRATVTATPTS